jgi:hypothetical protein
LARTVEGSSVPLNCCAAASAAASAFFCKRASVRAIIPTSTAKATMANKTVSERPASTAMAPRRFVAASTPVD